MEKFLIIMGGMRLVGKDNLRGQIEQDPVLGFSYDGLHYEPLKGVAFKILSDEKMGLLDDEVSAVEACIDAFRFRVWLLGLDGLPYAQAYQDEALGSYAHCLPPALPEHYWYNPASAQWDIIYGVDAEGRYIGNVPLIQCTLVANCRPSFDYERWDMDCQKWVDARSLPEMRDAAKARARLAADLAKEGGIVFEGDVIDSDTGIFFNYSASKKLAVHAFWRACEERYAAACAEIDAADTAEAIDGVAF
jgi:hypothetical protein